MSEYWVSKKKYWCQYCETFISDDVPSRTQHETGLRHKGNKDRFIRSLYKTGIKRKQDGEEENREMKRIEAAAEAAYAQDVSTGVARAGSSSSAQAAVAPKPRPAAPKPSDPYANYTTAASLGISDPDVDRLVAEADSRRSEGRAGDWVAVVPPPPPPPPSSFPQNGDSNGGGGADIKAEDGTDAGQVRKRVDDETTDEYDLRQFKMRKKTAAVGLGEIYDPGVIRIKPRAELTVKQESEITALKQGGHVSKSAQPLPAATERPEWVTRGWKRAGEGLTGEDADALTTEEKSHTISAAEDIPVADTKFVQETIKSDITKDIKKEEQVDIPSPAPNTGVKFRKRKVPTNAGGRRKDV
ncbi:hypothetical protein BU17DRAFT_46702 [Hysterangium stoloniferum]|nr:hypothetical protein BU17DRAFT_46702 [Hysterangium stoloniferum]